MKKIFSKIPWAKIKSFTSAHKPLTILSTIIFLSLVYVVFAKGGTANATQYVLARATTGDLAVSVSGSGQVATLGQVSIQPQTVGQAQTLGQIISVNVQNGDFVKQGQVIAELDGQNALQTLNQAKASVESAQASYDKLVDGPTASDLESTNNQIQSAQTTLQNDQQNMLLSVQSAYSSIANDVYINTDPLFQNVTSVNPTLSISGVNFLNQQLETNVTTGRASVGTALNAWQEEINNFSASSTATSTASTTLVTLLNDSISYLNQVRTYFSNMTTLFSSYGVAEDSTSQSTLDSDKGLASSAQSSVNSSISTLTSALQSYTSAQVSLAQDQESLALQVAPPDADDVTVSKSALDNANANLNNAEVNYASRIITAPFDGQIGGLTAQVGQQVSSSDSLGTLITSQRVINVTLNEVDAAKVEASDTAEISFDALPNLTIPGHVVYIDPLGTVSQGVVSYSVQIAMDTQNDSVKTGMTATVEINTTDDPNALMVPNAAIMTSGTTKYVLVAEASSTGMSASSTRNMNFATSSGNRNFASSTFAGFASTSSSTFANASSTRARGAFTGTIQVDASKVTIMRVPVTVGIANDVDTEILSGLTAGQLVVTRTITSAVSTTKSAAAAATTRSLTGAAGGRTGFTGGGGFGGAGAVGGAARL